jgi:ADP-ribose pyrophosphatase
VADSSRTGLPPLPAITLDVLGEVSGHAPESRFLHVRRVQMKALFPDGTESAPFVYDAVERRALDAVVVCAHYREHGERFVYLRSSLRPPVMLRPTGPAVSAHLWELPAGLMELGEAPAHAAAREVEEELGFTLPPEAFLPLGPAGLPAPAVLGELHFFFHVPVDPQQRGTPTEDGSALERMAAIIAVPLAEALEMCRNGLLPDEKTELALRRLAELP